jgi:CheY-like chemotaxis protein
MRNILLILENTIEFDLTKTVLQKLGFNVMWIQKGQDMHDKLSKNFPDLVITSVLGTDDEFLSEFTKVREKRGTPQFILVGPTSRLEKLKSSQRRLIDAHLQTPIQPDQLIQSVCLLFGLEAPEYLQKYRSMLTGAMTGKSVEKIKGSGSAKASDTIFVHGVSEPFYDSSRSKKYQSHADKIEKQDRVFSLREIDKRLKTSEATGNTPDLFEKKKNFIRALFKK